MLQAVRLDLCPWPCLFSLHGRIIGGGAIANQMCFTGRLPKISEPAPGTLFYFDNHAESGVKVTVGRTGATTAGGATIRRVVSPRSAAQDTKLVIQIHITLDRALRVGLGGMGVIVVAKQVLAPLRDVAVHIIKSPSVRLETLNGSRLLTKNSLLASIIRVSAIVVVAQPAG